MNINSIVLIADLDDWIKIFLFIVFILGPILGQFGKKPAQRAQPPGAPLPKRRRAAGPVESELEAMIRELQDGANLQGEPPRPPSRQKRGANAAGKEKGRLISVAEKPSRTTRPTGRGISDHVRQHMDSHPVSEGARALGQTIDKTDERVEQHLRDVFGRQLGDLQSDAAGTQRLAQIAEGTDSDAWARKSAGDQERVAGERLDVIRQMLGNAEGIRSAFVLGEILRSPVE